MQFCHILWHKRIQTTLFYTCNKLSHWYYRNNWINGTLCDTYLKQSIVHTSHSLLVVNSSITSNVHVVFLSVFKNFHCSNWITEFILCESIKSINFFCFVSFLCVYLFVSQGHKIKDLNVLVHFTFRIDCFFFQLARFGKMSQTVLYGKILNLGVWKSLK